MDMNDIRFSQIKVMFTNALNQLFFSVLKRMEYLLSLGKKRIKVETEVQTDSYNII